MRGNYVLQLASAIAYLALAAAAFALVHGSDRDWSGETFQVASGCVFFAYFVARAARALRRLLPPPQ
jgi:hypothetical protein